LEYLTDGITWKIHSPWTKSGEFN